MPVSMFRATTYRLPTAFVPLLLQRLVIPYATIKAVFFKIIQASQGEDTTFPFIRRIIFGYTLKSGKKGLFDVVRM